MPKPTYQTAQRSLASGLHDLNILAGEEVGPPGASWQDVAGTAALNLGTVVTYLENLRAGQLPATMLDLQAALPDKFAQRVSEVISELLDNQWALMSEQLVDGLKQLRDEADQHVRDRP